MASGFLKLFRSTDKSYEEMDDLETVTCPVCLEIFEKPLIISCGHVFCSQCLKNFDVPEPVCPLCRKTFDPSKSIKAAQMNKTLSSNKSNCHACSKKMVLNKLRSHLSTCPEQKEEITSDPSEETPTSDIPVNRHTFKCPYCGLRNLDSRALIKHVNEQHLKSTASVTCPICASMPWGDPNQISINFLAHLNMRHRFEYDTYVDYQIDDDDALQKALKYSMEEK
ncbi:Uncharacterised protein g10249 [Pycnogonum litorale]